MTPPSIGLLVAFGAGLLSFLSPCVLPLIPSYITFITGLSFEDVQHQKRTALIHGLLFTLGFSLIFIALGAGASLIGRLLFDQRDMIAKVGGVLIIVFGLYMLGILNIGAFSRERRVHLADKPVGYLGTVLVGFAFGAGWTPCIGPILGSIITYAGSEASLSRGVALLTMYSLGLAVPFIISAIAVDRFHLFFQKFRRQMIWMQRGAGVLMILVGILMITSQFTILAGYLQRFTPDFILERL
ncbi:MAG: cytochrome c biogenesis protein CcdA [Gemmatimonadaceae bacterium]